MGKIRIKHLGFGKLEEQEKLKAKKRKLKKKLKKKTAKAPGLKGGERVVAVGPSPEELEKSLAEGKRKKTEERKAAKAQKPTAPEKAKIRPPKKPSTRYQQLAKMIDKKKLYSPAEAITLLKKLANARFPETLEAHLNLKKLLPKNDQTAYQKRFATAFKQAAWQTASLPQGEKPKGSSAGRKPAALAKAPYPSLHFEKKFPLAHATLGKITQPQKTLEKNLSFLLKTLNPANIRKLTLSTTMSPSLKIVF